MLFNRQGAEQQRMLFSLEIKNAVKIPQADTVELFIRKNNLYIKCKLLAFIDAKTRKLSC